jgi:dUTP pyrophosphatase
MIDVKIILEDGATMPDYKTLLSSGADLCSTGNYLIRRNQRVLIKTGIRIQLEEGYEAQVRPRSGMSLKMGLTAILGTIDADYTGEIGVIAHNVSDDDITVVKGDRVAQLVIAPVVQANFIVTDKLDETTRGDGGFGSTGK